MSWSSDGSYSGGTAHSYAVSAGIWDSGDFFDVKWNVNYVGDGESIGRDKYSTDYDQPDDWDDHGGIESHYATKGGPNRGPIYSPYDGIMKTQEMINQILIDRGYDVIYANHTKLEIIEDDNETYVYAEHNFETKYHTETVFFHGTALFHWYETDESSSESKINVELQSDYNATVKLNYSNKVNGSGLTVESNEEIIIIHESYNYSSRHDENISLYLTQINENTFEENSTMHISEGYIVMDITTNLKNIIHSDTLIESIKNVETYLNGEYDTSFNSHYNTSIDSDDPEVYVSTFYDYTINSSVANTFIPRSRQKVI